jgi:hypothetical protein
MDVSKNSSNINDYYKVINRVLGKIKGRVQGCEQISKLIVFPTKDKYRKNNSNKTIIIK